MTEAAVETHVNDPIDTKRELRGNTRKASDAPPEIQQKIVDIIIEEARKRQFNNRDIAYYVAIAKRESGFNPDAANSNSTASGIAQMIDKSGEKYGLNAANRFDARSSIAAGLDYFVHIKQKIQKDFGSATGKYEALIYYCYHYGEFSVNRREKVKGNWVVKEAYPFSDLEGTAKYEDSQTVVNEAAKFEKIFNDTHALKIQIQDILGKPMPGRKVIVVQKKAVSNSDAANNTAPSAPTASVPPVITPSTETAIGDPSGGTGSESDNNPTNTSTTATEASTDTSSSEMCLRPPPEPQISWELVIKEYATDGEGNIPVIDSDTQEPILVLIPRIDYEAYNKAVAEYAVCESGNAHRIQASGNEQGALPTIKTEEKAQAPFVTEAAPAATPPSAPAMSSPLASIAQDKKDAAAPKPSPGPTFEWADVVAALHRHGWAAVYQTSFAYVKQFFTRPKLPTSPFAQEPQAIKTGPVRTQVINSSIKAQDTNTLRVKDQVTTAQETAVKQVEDAGDAPWMKFAIEEQGKSGEQKVEENRKSHVTNPSWSAAHKERTEAEAAAAKAKRELIQENKKPATHKALGKARNPATVESLEKTIQEQEAAAATADDKMKEIEKEYNNSDIVKYLQSAHLGRDMARDDGTAWCASFLNWCIEATGKYAGLKEGAARAESWRQWGEKIDEPKYGAITIVTRAANPTQYHVGFYTGIQDVNVKDGKEEVEVKGKNGEIKKIMKDKYRIVKKVRLLSGNMSNKITESAGWTVDAADDAKLHLVEYRWPTAKERK